MGCLSVYLVVELERLFQPLRDEEELVDPGEADCDEVDGVRGPLQGLLPRLIVLGCSV